MPEPIAPEHPAPNPTEFRILDLVVKGKNNSQIAKALRMSVHTVKTYVQRLMKAWKVHSRGELAYAVLGARVVPCPCRPVEAHDGEVARG